VAIVIVASLLVAVSLYMATAGWRENRRTWRSVYRRRYAALVSSAQLERRAVYEQVMALCRTNLERTAMQALIGRYPNVSVPQAQHSLDVIRSGRSVGSDLPPTR
jgi:hypothetical protein